MQASKRAGVGVIAVMTAVLTGVALAQPRGGGGGGGGQHGPPPGGGQGQGQGQGQRGPGGQGGGQGGGGGGGNGPTSRPSPDQLFDRADTNHDGVLSREEFKEFLAHRPPPGQRPPQQGSGDRT